MNINQFNEKINEMMPELMKETVKECERLYQSGGIDTRKFDNDYVLPKIILTVALENMAHQYMPFHPDYKRDVRNLHLF